MAEELFRALELNDLTDAELEPILVLAAADAILDATEPSTTTLAVVCTRFYRIVLTKRFSRLLRDKIRAMDPSCNCDSMMPLEIQGVDTGGMCRVSMTAMNGELFFYNEGSETVCVYGHEKLSAAGNLLPSTEKSLKMAERRRLPITLSATSASDVSRWRWFDWFGLGRKCVNWLKLESCAANNSLYVEAHHYLDRQKSENHLLRLDAMTGHTLAQMAWMTATEDEHLISVNICNTGHVLLGIFTEVRELDVDLKLLRKLDLRQHVLNEAERPLVGGIHQFEESGNYLIWYVDLFDADTSVIWAHTQLASGSTEILVPVVRRRCGSRWPINYVDTGDYALVCYRNDDRSYHVELMGQSLRILRELEIGSVDGFLIIESIDKECGLMYVREITFKEPSMLSNLSHRLLNTVLLGSGLRLHLLLDTFLGRPITRDLKVFRFPRRF